MKKHFDSLGVLLLVCACVPLVFGTYSLFHAISFLSRAEKVVGTVIAIHVEKPWPGKRVGSFPVTEFVDVRGQRHEVELRSYAFPVILEIGKTINLLFDPASPKNAIPDSWRARWAQPFIGLVFGTMLLGAAFFIGRATTAPSGDNQSGAGL
jgi:hypothetical protein